MTGFPPMTAGSTRILSCHSSMILLLSYLTAGAGRRSSGSRRRPGSRAWLARSGRHTYLKDYLLIPGDGLAVFSEGPNIELDSLSYMRQRLLQALPLGIAAGEGWHLRPVAALFGL